MTSASYIARRAELERYFDRTAVDAWTRLTSDAPVSRVRATVRAGRDKMRETLLPGCLQDLRGARVLDAGCGTGALAVALARRGADVLGDRRVADAGRARQERAPQDLAPGRVDFSRSATCSTRRLAASTMSWRWTASSTTRARTSRAWCRALAARAESGVRLHCRPAHARFTLMHAVGRLLPRGDRAPSIAPISRRDLEVPPRARTAGSSAGASRAAHRDRRAASTSPQALEVARS